MHLGRITQALSETIISRPIRPRYSVEKHFGHSRPESTVIQQAATNRWFGSLGTQVDEPLGSFPKRAAPTILNEAILKGICLPPLRRQRRARERMGRNEFWAHFGGSARPWPIRPVWTGGFGPGLRWHARGFGFDCTEITFFSSRSLSPSPLLKTLVGCDMCLDFPSSISLSFTQVMSRGIFIVVWMIWPLVYPGHDDY